MRPARYLNTPNYQGILAAQVSTLTGRLSASQYIHATLPLSFGLWAPTVLSIVVRVEDRLSTFLRTVVLLSQSQFTRHDFL